MQSASYQLFHSAKGTSWQSKDHKYIAIENGRYIYPEDMKGGKKKSGVSGVGVTPSEYRSNVTQNKIAAAPSQSGNVQYAGKKVTPSEYRALVASNSKSLNKDGSIRANSAAARGDVQSSMGDKKITRKTVSGTPTQGLNVHTPIPNIHRSTGHVTRAPGSGKKTPLSAGKVSKYNAGAIKPSNSHGMTLSQYLRSNGTKGNTSNKLPNSYLNSSDSSAHINVGKKTVDNILSKLKSQSVSRNQDQKIRKETEVRERELQRRHNSK